MFGSIVIHVSSCVGTVNKSNNDVSAVRSDVSMVIYNVELSSVDSFTLIYVILHWVLYLFLCSS